MDDKRKRAALTDLERANKSFKDHERGLWLAVDIAREHGASWADIGNVLGVSRQAAQERFSKGPRP